MLQRTLLTLAACTVLGLAGLTSTANASWVSQALRGQPLQPSRYYGYNYGHHHHGYNQYHYQTGYRGCGGSPYQYGGYQGYGYQNYHGHDHYGNYGGGYYGQPGYYGRW